MIVCQRVGPKDNTSSLSGLKPNRYVVWHWRCDVDAISIGRLISRKNLALLVKDVHIRHDVMLVPAMEHNFMVSFFVRSRRVFRE